MSEAMKEKEAKRWAEVRSLFGACRDAGGIAAVPPEAAPEPREADRVSGKSEGPFGGRALPEAPPGLKPRFPMPAGVPDAPPVARPVPREPFAAPASEAAPAEPAASPPVVTVPAAEKAAETQAPAGAPAPVVEPPRPVPAFGGGVRLNPVRIEGRTLVAPLRTPASLGLSSPGEGAKPGGLPVPPPPPIGFPPKAETEFKIPPMPQVPAFKAPAPPEPKAAVEIPKPAPEPKFELKIEPKLEPLPEPKEAPAPAPKFEPFVAPKVELSADAGSGAAPKPAGVEPPPAPPAPEVEGPKKAGAYFKSMSWKKPAQQG